MPINLARNVVSRHGERGECTGVWAYRIDANAWAIRATLSKERLLWTRAEVVSGLVVRPDRRSDDARWLAVDCELGICINITRWQGL